MVNNKIALSFFGLVLAAFNVCALAAGEAQPAAEITVKPQETLWSIASRTRPPAYVNVQQHMLAILRENPEAFERGNINGLIVGARLRLPQGGPSLSSQAAIQEATRQNAAWRERPAMPAAKPADGTPKAAAETSAKGVAGEGAEGAEDETAPVPAALPILTRQEEDAAATAVVGADAAAVDAGPDSLADELRRLREQAFDQERQLQRKEEEILQLGKDLAAEKERWAKELTWWRGALTVSVAAAVVLFITVLLMRRRSVHE